MFMEQHAAGWERVKELRLTHRYTQAQLAGYLNISRSTYAGYEADAAHIPMEYLPPLALLYNVSADYLLGLTPVKTPRPKK